MTYPGFKCQFIVDPKPYAQSAPTQAGGAQKLEFRLWYNVKLYTCRGVEF